MKSVSQDFLDAQANNTIQYYYEVNMYRRYWDSGTYLYEETATDLKPYILSKGNINWQLDKEGLNVWRVSNVQLVLKNDYGQFNEGSAKFFNDTYQRFKTKIVIKIGYVLPDETTEIVYAFLGLIVDDVVNNQEEQSISISLIGKEILLSLANAENVTNVVTDETLGTGALKTKFYTSNNNVLSVSKVYIDGVEQTLTTHYTVGYLYDIDKGALITFVTAPALKEVLTTDYTYGNNESVNNERIGTGTLNNVFYTANKGVGKVNTVYLDGEELDVIDYSVSKLNNKNNYGKITFPVGIGVGQVVKCDYDHWYKDIAIDTIIGYLLDEGEFPAGQRTIGAIDVGAFLKYEIWNTKADWDALNKSRNIDTDTQIGGVLVANENLDTDIDTNVNMTLTGSFPSQIAAISSPMTYDNKYEAVALPQNSVPSWSKHVDLDYGAATESISSGILLNTITSDGVHECILRYEGTTNCLCFRVRLKLSLSIATAGAYFWIWAGGGIGPTIHFAYVGGEWVMDNHVGGASTAVGTGITDIAWGDYHIFDMQYNEDTGHIKIYMDDVEKFDCNYGTGWGGNDVDMGLNMTNITNNEVLSSWIDYVYWIDSSVNRGLLLSDGINLGVASPVISTLGTILMDSTIPGDGSTLTIYTQTSGTSDFSSDNDSWRTVSFSGDVGTISASTVSKRYIRWKAIFYKSGATSPTIIFFSMPAHFLSNTVDCGTNLDVYDLFTTLKVDYDGAIKIYSQTSADDITWDAEVLVTGGVIASTKRRYIRFRTVIYFTSTGDSPEIQKEYFTYKITSLNIAMANFTGMTVQGVMEEFAKILNYEIGVDASGKYFMRARNESTSIDMELSDKTNISSVDNADAGWKRIFNEIKVEIGNFTSIMSPETEGETEPHSITKYGVRKLNIKSSNIDVDNNLDLASGLVEIYYDMYKEPKKPLRLRCKMLPQLELSDTVNINFLATSWSWYWGDPTTWWGNPAKCWHNKEMLPVVDLVSNVIGLELDINNWALYINIREI